MGLQRLFFVLIASYVANILVEIILGMFGITNMYMVAVFQDGAWALILSYAFWRHTSWRYAHKYAEFHQTFLILFAVFFGLTVFNFVLSQILIFVPSIIRNILYYVATTLVYATTFSYLNYPATHRRTAHLNPAFRQLFLTNLLVFGLFNLLILL